MLNIVLNILGIIIIAYAIISIVSARRKEEIPDSTVIDENFKRVLEKKKSENPMKVREDIKKEERESYEVELSEFNEELFKNFNEGQKHKKYQEYTKLKPKSLVRDVKVEEKPIDNLPDKNKKIIELSRIGLSKEEIAKQCGRSIREIEVILKIYGGN